MEFATTTLSSKGQIVIPQKMRQIFHVGEKILLAQEGDKIFLKKTKHFENTLKEDLEFEQRTREAQERIDRGEGIEMDFDDFINKMKKW